MGTMRVTRIIIDRREYPLAPEQDVEPIIERITEQVRAGGGFVELVGSPQRTVYVLVTPGTTLSIEVAEVARVEAVEAGEPRPARVVESWERSWLDPFDLP